MREQLVNAIRLEGKRKRLGEFGGEIDSKTGNYVSPVNMAAAKSRTYRTLFESGDAASIAAQIPGQSPEGAQKYLDGLNGLSPAQRRREILRISNRLAFEEVGEAQGIGNLQGRAQVNRDSVVAPPRKEALPNVEESQKFQARHKSALRVKVVKGQNG